MSTLGDSVESIPMTNATTVTYERALDLLGQGLSTSIVASALGVTDSAISQLLSNPDFAAKVQELRVAALRKSSELDNTYNDIEDKLLDKLERVMPIINKPRDILSAIKVINGAKRRGVQSTGNEMAQAKIVQITLPQVINTSYVTNVNNQITEVQDENGQSKTLVTMQSGSLDKFANNFSPKRLSKLTDSESSPERCEESSECEGASALANSL